MRFLILNCDDAGNDGEGQSRAGNGQDRNAL